MSEEFTLTVDEDSNGMRLDKFLSQQLSELSRSRLQALIHDDHVTSDGQQQTDAATKVKAGQTVCVHVPSATPSEISAQDIPLNIVFEDDDILVLNKPAGLTVHPAPGHPDSTLVNALLAHCGDSLSGIGGVMRPGIVHRLDKDTSGLMVVAKNDAAHHALSKQLSERTLKRTYHALIWGTPTPLLGTITGDIGRSPSNRKKMCVRMSGGKPATTHYKVLQQFDSAPICWVECNLETGRTHQIRVHFTHKGHGLVGDPVYGQSTTSRLKALRVEPAIEQALLAFTRQALHAKALELIHPASKQAMQFACDLPDDMQALIVQLS